jgi:hypothetical protein
MNKQEIVDRKLRGLPDLDLNELSELMLPAQSSLAKDWLTPEEESAWASL